MAKTVHKWPLVDTQILGSLTHLQIIEQNPSVVAEDIEILHLESLIYKSLQHQLDLPSSLAAKHLDLEGTISIYMSTVAAMLPVTFVESMAWLWNIDT